MLLPVSAVAKVAYCPRVFGIEQLHGEWAESADTIEGEMVHRKVDQPSEAGLPDPGDEPERPIVRRSVHLSDEELGLVARIDLVEAEGGEVTPVEFKKGRPPEGNPPRAWETAQVQVCAQALLLRAHGYTCRRGFVYYAAARRRVEVPIDDDLIARTLALRDQARAILESGRLPPPLVASRRCDGCSLVGICLPDEVQFLQGGVDEIRPLTPARDDRIPLVVQTRGARLGLKGGELVARDRDGELGRARLEETSEVVLLGNISVTTPALWELARRDIPVAFHGYGGWYHGSFLSSSGVGALHRIAQHQRAGQPEQALSIARTLVASKIRNQRVMLRRNGQGVPKSVLDDLRDLATRCRTAPDTEELMGLEGAAASLYFANLPRMLRCEDEIAFDFRGRNRRPPRDPVNSALSFCYAMLVRAWTHVLHRVGLDPYVGFLHAPRVQRPALALDMMEPFRPLVADSAVLTAFNNGSLKAKDFLVHPTGVTLGKAGKKRLVQTFERRMDELATHPVFRTRLSMRRIFEVQARLLVRVLHGEISELPQYVVR